MYLAREFDLQQYVMSRCTSLKIRFHHCGAAIHCLGGAGFPDLFLIGAAGFLFVELKLSDKKALTGDQKKWKYALEAQSVPYQIWTGKDASSGKIDRELQRIAG